jgi:hypothetical protein
LFITKTNVSKVVKAMQTQLLETSKFSDEQETQEDNTELLGDAYDLYYGRMEQDVLDVVQAHEEAANAALVNNGIMFQSAEQVIAALQAQWATQEELNSSLATEEALLKNQEDTLDAIEDEYDDLKDALEDYREELERVNQELATQLALLLDIDDAEVQSISTGEREYTPGTTTEDILNSVDPYSGGTGTITINPDTGLPDAGGGPPDYGQNDSQNDSWWDNVTDWFDGWWPFAEGGIVTRPTRAIVGEAGPEAVIPLNKMGMMGGVHIENITIHGATGDGGDFAHQFAMELKKELRTM